MAHSITGTQATPYSALSNVCPWLAVLLALKARRENGFATAWDRIPGTRVVLKPKGTPKPAILTATSIPAPAHAAGTLGPYRVTGELLPGKWMVASTHPVLHRQGPGQAGDDGPFGRPSKRRATRSSPMAPKG